MSDHPVYWQNWPGPTGTTGPSFLGVTGAVTGPAFFGVTGASGPTGIQSEPVKLRYLYNRARIELVGASDTMIRSVMYDVFHEFFNDSSLWLEAIPGQLFPGTKFYFLEPGNPQSMGDPFPCGVIQSLAGLSDLNTFAISADMPEPPVLRLQFQQNNIMSVFATVIKNVAIPCGSEIPAIPHWVVETYEPYLLAGIKGMMMMQADKPYSDPKLGMMMYQRFRQGVNMARTRALHRNTYGGQAWAYPQQFRTNSQHGWAVTTGNTRRF